MSSSNGVNVADVKARVETITPEKAAKWLETNTQNRAINQRNVDFFAQQILAGLYPLNGEPFIFDEDDNLIDGQHRAWAVIEAKKPIVSVVVRGIRRKDADTIDTGKSRTASDVLHRAGMTNTLNLAAALTWVRAWEGGFASAVSGGNKARVPNIETVRLAKKYDDLWNHIGPLLMASKRTGIRMGKGAVIFLRWATFRAKPRLAEAFWRDVENGENISRGDPTFMLRERLTAYGTKAVRSDGRRRRSSGHAESSELLAMGIKAWNAYVSNEKIHILRHRTVDSFPMIDGLPCPRNAVKAPAVESAA